MNAKRVLVPVRGTAADEAAIALAGYLAKKQKGKVFVVYVIEVDRSLPLDAEVESQTQKAEAVLTRAEDLAGDEGYDIDTDLLQAREAGPGIVDEAVERDVGLVVMAVPYKKRLGEFRLGETVSYVLREAPCQVLLYRGASDVMQA